MTSIMSVVDAQTCDLGVTLFSSPEMMNVNRPQKINGTFVKAILL
jgi:hypothetical protein